MLLRCFLFLLLCIGLLGSHAPNSFLSTVGASMVIICSCAGAFAAGIPLPMMPAPLVTFLHAISTSNACSKIIPRSFNAACILQHIGHLKKWPPRNFTVKSTVNCAVARFSSKHWELKLLRSALSSSHTPSRCCMHALTAARNSPCMSTDVKTEPTHQDLMQCCL